MANFLAPNFFAQTTLLLLLLITTHHTLGQPCGISAQQNALPPVRFDDFNLILDQIRTQFAFELGALADGDELYRLEGDLSPDCRVTMLAYTRMLQNWTSYPDVPSTLSLNRLQPTGPSQHPFEAVCQLVEELIRNSGKYVDDFTRLKSALKDELTAKPKYYFDHLLRTNEDVDAAFPTILSIPGVARMMANEEFRKQRYAQVAYTHDAFILAKAVETVASKGPVYKALVQQIYDQVMAETAREISQIKGSSDLVLKGYRTYKFTPFMLEQLQKRIDEDPRLQMEVENGKKLVTATLQSEPLRRRS